MTPPSPTPSAHARTRTRNVPRGGLATDERVRWRQAAGHQDGAQEKEFDFGSEVDKEVELAAVMTSLQ